MAVRTKYAIQIELTPAQLDRIKSAALNAGATVQDFALEALLKQAGPDLDCNRIVLDEASYEALLRMLDEPMPASQVEALRRLFADDDGNEEDGA